MTTSHTPETDNEAYMVECTSVQNYGIEDPSEVVDADFARRLERQRNELLEAVSLAEHTFRHYANLHAAKGPEGADKALRNTELADRMEAAIQKAEGRL